MNVTTSIATFAEIAEACARLYELPGDDFQACVRSASRSARSVSDEAAGALEELALEVESIGSVALEEAFVRTFELQPSCSPYAGPHLYGEEGFQRGRMLSGLREGFERHGFDTRGELPDHVAVLMRFAARLEPAERTELCEWCLARPLTAMAEQLSASANPYRHLARATRILFASEGVPQRVTEVLSRTAPAKNDDGCGGVFSESEET
ncbi:MAG: molecular chaperone TorD family protein [Planctomycetota bacterium]|nr:molecular chaperone TorD family protein [Planctomycetota bacterium]